MQPEGIRLSFFLPAADRAGGKSANRAKDYSLWAAINNNKSEERKQKD